MAEQLKLGTVIPDGAVPANAGQRTHYSQYGQGGLHTGDAYPDLAAVYELPLDRREWGLEVKTLDGGRYELVRGLASLDLADNANWRPLVLGSATPPPVAFTNQTILTITHNLGRLVQVQVYDPNGYEIGGQVQQVGLNIVEVQFSQPLSGTVVLR